jgi:hypothetical protein
MSELPEAYCEIITPLIGTARGILERGESLAHMAFVGNLTTGETKIVPIQATSEQAKDDAAALLRHLAHLLQADFIFTIMDAWGLPKDKMHRMQQILDEYGSIGASPYRIDIVALALETRHGIWVAQMPVKPKGISKMKKTFGEPRFQLFTDAQGRFVDLLPIKDEGAPAAGGLH